MGNHTPKIQFAQPVWTNTYQEDKLVTVELMMYPCYGGNFAIYKLTGIPVNYCIEDGALIWPC